MPIVAIANHPEFVKWQSDLLVNGSQEVFLAAEGWAAPQATQLFTWDTRFIQTATIVCVCVWCAMISNT